MEGNSCDYKLEEYALGSPGINELRPLTTVEIASDDNPCAPESTEILEVKGSGRKLKWCLLIFSLVIVLVMVFPIFPYFLSSHDQITPTFPQNSSHCATPTCQRAADRLLALHSDFDPCQNFYQFSCGNLRGPSAFEEMEKSILRDIKKLIESKSEKNEVKAVKNAKRLYYFCTHNFSQLNTYEDHTLPLLSVLQSTFGHWPMLQGADWNQSEYRLEGLLAQLFAHQVPNIFELHIVKDEADSPFQLSLGTGKPVISEAFFNVNIADYVRYVDYYKKLILGSAQLLEHGKNGNLAISEDVDDVIEFERRFARIVQSSNCEFNGVHSLEEETYTYINTDLTLRDIQEQLQKVNVEYLVQQVLYDLGIKHNVSSDMKVSLKCMKLFREVSVLSEASDARTMANYLIWRFVFHHLPYMGGDFRKIWIEFLSHVPLAIDWSRNPFAPRWQQCVRIVNQEFGPAVGYFYAQENQQKLNSSEAIADKIRSYLIQAFSNAITEQQWIEDEFKLQLIEKISHPKVFIGGAEDYSNVTDLEEEFKGLELNGSNFLLQLLQIRKFNVARGIKNKQHLLPEIYKALDSPLLYIQAFHVFRANVIVVPLGMLRFPLFDESYPMYLNFANLGFLLGHELAHGLDSYGRYFDKHGNNSPWWPEEAEATFKTKAACFADQYGKFKIPQVDAFLDGNRTLGENLSDNTALRISWLAYKMWARENNLEELPLPGTNFTVPQIFYITFGQIWCESLSKEAYYQKYIRDEHSPGQFRVLGVVQNDAEFGEIFDCPPGTPMNPTDKCTLW